MKYKKDGWHTLTDLDAVQRTATCVLCGPTKIRKAGRGRWRCRSSGSRHKRHTPEAQALLARSDGTCEICGDEADLVVDHCHKDDHVRGLLCRDCNLALGFMQDNPDRLLAAVAYLNR